MIKNCYYKVSCGICPKRPHHEWTKRKMMKVELGYMINEKKETYLIIMSP